MELGLAVLVAGGSPLSLGVAEALAVGLGVSVVVGVKVDVALGGMGLGGVVAVGWAHAAVESSGTLTRRDRLAARL